MGCKPSLCAVCDIIDVLEQGDPVSFDKMSSPDQAASPMTPLRVCATPKCDSFTRPYKRDPSKVTKYCDTCKERMDFEAFFGRPDEEVPLAPKCFTEDCTNLTRRMWSNSARFTKYCDHCLFNWYKDKDTRKASFYKRLIDKK